MTVERQLLPPHRATPHTSHHPTMPAQPSGFTAPASGRHVCLYPLLPHGSCLAHILPSCHHPQPLASWHRYLPLKASTCWLPDIEKSRNTWAVQTAQEVMVGGNIMSGPDTSYPCGGNQGKTVHLRRKPPVGQFEAIVVGGGRKGERKKLQKLHSCDRTQRWGLAITQSKEVILRLIDIQFKPLWDSLCPCECQPVFISQSTNIYWAQGSKLEGTWVRAGVHGGWGWTIGPSSSHCTYAHVHTRTYAHRVWYHWHRNLDDWFW